MTRSNGIHAWIWFCLTLLGLPRGCATAKSPFKSSSSRKVMWWWPPRKKSSSCSNASISIFGNTLLMMFYYWNNQDVPLTRELGITILSLFMLQKRRTMDFVANHETSCCLIKIWLMMIHINKIFERFVYIFLYWQIFSRQNKRKLVFRGQNEILKTSYQIWGWWRRLRHTSFFTKSR